MKVGDEVYLETSTGIQLVKVVKVSSEGITVI